jgi:hypothetical protein
MSVGFRSFAAIVGVLAVACGAVPIAAQGNSRLSPPSRPALRSASGYEATAQGIPTLSQLLANFAVLRRPQAAADRSWRPPPCTCDARLLPTLTRLARRLRNGTRVFLTVQRYTGPGWPSVYPVGSYELDIYIVPRVNRGYGMSTNFGPNVNYTVFPLTPRPPSAVVRHGSAGPTTPTWASIIPNGVARVRWTLECGCGRRRVTATVPVHENVAAANIPATEPKRGSARIPRRLWQPVTSTWYGSGGRVVASYRLGPNNLSAPPFVKAR